LLYFSKDESSLDQQGGLLTGFPFRRAALDQVAAEVAHDKATHRQARGQDLLQQARNAGGGDRLNTAAHQQDAAALGPQVGSPLEQAHLMALSLQEQGQQQAAAAGAHDGNAGNATGRSLAHGESGTGGIRPYGVRSGGCVAMTTQQNNPAKTTLRRPHCEDHAAKITPKPGRAAAPTLKPVIGSP
jgi:hypothetical protein